MRKQQRPRYGFYVDHVIDALGSMFLLGGLALSGYMSPYVAMGLLVAYLMLSIEVYLATYCLNTFRISFWKFGPTELRILLVVGNLALFLHPTTTILGKTYHLFDVGGLVAIAGLGLTLVASVVMNTRALPKRSRDHNGSPRAGGAMPSIPGKRPWPSALAAPVEVQPRRGGRNRGAAHDSLAAGDRPGS